MEAAIRYSQNSPGDNTLDHQHFLHVDVANKHFQLCQTTDKPRKHSSNNVKYNAVAVSGPKVPAFRAFDWHPTLENLVVVGQTSGEATLLSLQPVDSDGSKSAQVAQTSAPSSAPTPTPTSTLTSLSFNIRSQRPSNAVALSSRNLLAAGLDRVRTDFCLNIWDFSHQLPASLPTSQQHTVNRQPFSFARPSTSNSSSVPEPLYKLAPGEPITSLKFFSSSPTLLVAGVKGQFVRLYDLRDPASASPSSTHASASGSLGGSGAQSTGSGTSSGAGGTGSSSVNVGLQFPTRCVHNLAIDWRDENYFASCYPSGPEAMVCVWDRRMHSRSVGSVNVVGSSSSSTYENRGGPEVSLELKDSLGVGASKTSAGASIWSARFSKSRRGCLGVLSSVGDLKVYDIGRDFEEQDETYAVGHNMPPRLTVGDNDDDDWETKSPQGVYLDRSQLISNPFSTAPNQDDKARIVSFDFTTSSSQSRQPEIITLSGNGEIRTTTPQALPEPAAMSTTGWFIKGRSQYVQELLAQELGKKEDEKSSLDIASAVKSIVAQEPPTATLASSLSPHVSNADLLSSLPISLTDALPSLLTLNSIARYRCRAGYLLHPSTNRTVVADDLSLQTLWNWVDRAQRISHNGRMIADNFDLAYLGVHAVWTGEMDDDALKLRTLGQRATSEKSQKKLSKVIETLVRRLNLPVNRGVHTEHKHVRQLCLYISNLSWSSHDLEIWTKKLAHRGQHTKAAFMALVGTDVGLVFKVLGGKKVGEVERMLGVVLAGAGRTRRARKGREQSQKEKEDWDSDDDEIGNDDDVWSSTITSLSADVTDPYARAILAYAKTSDWAEVLKEANLPLKYLLCVALRHLDDTGLGKYISQTVQDVIERGDNEGIILTGTGTKEGFELMKKYVARFGDLQSAVLALAPTIPRYVSKEATARKFEAWKQAYRGMMNSWGCRMERVRFDIAVQKVQVENGTGRRISKPGKPQVSLVCNYCASSIAHHDAEDDGVATNGTKIHDTARHPLTPATAAAMGTSCPRCGRKLPRCGVCDLWLGTADDSFLKWYGKDKTTKEKSSGSAGSVDLSGSAHTIIGPGEKRATAESITTSGRTMAGSKRGDGSTGSADAKTTSIKTTEKDVNGVVVAKTDDNANDDSEEVVDNDADRAKRQDELMSRFTVFCVKCSHAFHATHARMWFQGSAEEGRSGHQFCPVPRCDCVCYG